MSEQGRFAVAGTPTVVAPTNRESRMLQALAAGERLSHQERQVRVQLPEWNVDAASDTYTEVDESIADLLEALWAAGFDTEQSCEGRIGQPAWITFTDPKMAHDFVYIATGSDEPPSGWSLDEWNKGANANVSFPPTAIPTVRTAVDVYTMWEALTRREDAVLVHERPSAA